MRAGAYARISHICDELTLFYLNARFYTLSKAVRMRIQRLVAACVPYDHDLAVAAFSADEFYRALARGLYRSAFSGAVIHAQMRLVSF